ncbi:MAG: hypothetical protein QOE64_1459 [Frankiales bacterium]|nr:hypothetical protein [Frankiales bacterium]
MRGERWSGVGRSDEADAASAGSSAAGRALAGREDARLVVLFCSERYDVPTLLSGVRSVTGAVPLIGCSTAGEIATGGPGDDSVVVMALGGPGFSVRTSAARHAGADLRAAGETAAGCMADLDARPHRALLLLSDALSGDQRAVVRGAYGAVGAEVPLVGGCAGDDLRMQRTLQIHGDEVLTDAVVGAAIGSDAPLGIGVSHGWREVGEPMLVTGSRGNRVLSIDDEPALDVYLGRLDAPAEAHVDPDAFTMFALTHPLGISRRSGAEVRFIAGADFTERSLGCVAHVPQGGLAWFMEGDHDSVLRATEEACAQALDALSGEPAVALLAFDCIARRGVLGDEGIEQEVEAVVRRAAGAPVAGFYTYGEIARTRGTAGFHNQTLVVLAMA